MDRLSSQLSEALTPLGFKPKEIHLHGSEFGALYGWKRQSWNSNYGIALVELKKVPRSIDTAYIQRLTKVVGKDLGYITFLNPIGLQLILVGPGLQARVFEPKNFVDRIQTFTVIVQSVFIVDTAAKSVEKSTTWGQFNSKKFRKAIETTLDQFVS